MYLSCQFTSTNHEIFSSSCCQLDVRDLARAVDYFFISSSGVWGLTLHHQPRTRWVRSLLSKSNFLHKSLVVESRPFHRSPLRWNSLSAMHKHTPTRAGLECQPRLTSWSPEDDGLIWLDVIWVAFFQPLSPWPPPFALIPGPVTGPISVWIRLLNFNYITLQWACFLVGLGLRGWWG